MMLLVCEAWGGVGVIGDGGIDEVFGMLMKMKLNQSIKGFKPL